jgi:hypothetical protein
MTWIIILAILLFIMAWLLLAPVFLYISTTESKYEAGLKGVFKVMIKMDSKEFPYLLGKVFFYSFRIQLFKVKAKKIKAATPRKRRKKMRKLVRKKMRVIMKIVWKVIRSYKLKQLKLNIDTGDVIRNAHLIPVFSIVHQEKVKLAVNYEDKTEFLLHLESSLGRMLYIMTTTYLKHHLKK